MGLHEQQRQTWLYYRHDIHCWICEKGVDDRPRIRGSKESIVWVTEVDLRVDELVCRQSGCACANKAVHRYSTYLVSCQKALIQPCSKPPRTFDGGTTIKPPILRIDFNKRGNVRRNRRPPSTQSPTRITTG
jgi:hypothetical protein